MRARAIVAALLTVACAGPPARQATPSPETARSRAAASASASERSADAADLARKPESTTKRDPFAIDLARWQDVASLCHPAEAWDDAKGCVPTARAKSVRCGSEEDARTSCACNQRDLLCLMRCVERQRPRPRLPHWEGPAPPTEHPDCDKQCRTGHAPSCLRLGTAFVQSRGKLRDLPRGMDLIERSCRLGYGPACSGLFHLYNWLPESRTREFAARVEESSCLHSPDYVSCKQAAEAYAEGWGVARNAEKANAYRARACEVVTKGCTDRVGMQDSTRSERESSVRRCIDERRVCPPHDR